MNPSTRNPEPQAFATLRRFVRSRAAVERCELCGLELAPEHRHLLEMAKRKITCACDPCALRFTDVVDGRFKLIPRDARVLPDFRIDRRAMGGSRAADQSRLSLSRFGRGKNHGALSGAGGSDGIAPAARGLANAGASRIRRWRGWQPDVEALLVNRVGEAREYFIAPIDACFELVGTDPDALARAVGRERSVARDRRVFRAAQGAVRKCEEVGRA